MLLKSFLFPFLLITFTPFAYTMEKVKEIPSLYKTIISFWAHECLKNDLSYTLKLEQRLRHAPSYAINDLQCAIIAFDPTFFFKELVPASCKGLPGSKTDITLVALSPTGTYAAAASKDNKVRLWDLKKRDCDVFNNHKDTIIALAFSKDGQTLISVSADCVAHIVPINQQKEIISRTFKPSWAKDRAVHCSLTPDLGCALLVFSDRSSCLVDFGLHNNRIFRLPHLTNGAFSTDGTKVLYFSPATNYIELHTLNIIMKPDDAKSDDAFLKITHNAQGAISASFSGDGNHIIFATNDRKTHTVSIANPIIREIDESVNETIPQSILNHNGTLALFNKSTCMCIFLLDLKTNPPTSIKLIGERAHAPTALLHTTTPKARCIINTFHPENIMALTAWHSTWHPNDSKTLLWLLQEPGPIPIALSMELINSAAFSADGRYLIAGYDDGIVNLWDFQEAKKPNLTLTQLIAMLKFVQGCKDPVIEAVLNSLPFSRIKTKASCSVS